MHMRRQERERSRPGEDQRKRDEPARRVAEPPGAAERDRLRPVDDAAREHGDRSATALIAVAVASATSMPTICSARSSAAFGPISRRSRIAPTMISSMFPACWPTTLQNGSVSPMSSCALTTLGDEDPGPEPQAPEVERGDPEAPAGGQTALTEAV